MGDDDASRPDFSISGRRDGSADGAPGSGAAVMDGRPPPSPLSSVPIRQARRAKIESVANIAAQWADEVDRTSRTPKEVLAALREAELLGLTGCADSSRFPLSMIADECFRLARSCSSSAMIYAMHHIQASCIVRHGYPGQAYAFARLAPGNVLIASCTSTRPGTADRFAVADGQFQVEKSLVALSYASEADAVLALAPRPGDDQSRVLAAVFREDFSFTPDVKWSALGMRGTASAGGVFVGHGSAGQILEEDYEIIDRETTLPVAHILLSSVWAGIAAEAVHRARLSCARREREAVSRSLFRATTLARRMRSSIETALGCFDANEAKGGSDGPEFESVMNLLKIEVSQMGCEAVLEALSAGGMACYRDDTPWSIGRLLRDIVSAPIMINNSIIEGRELAKIHDSLSIERFARDTGD